LTKLELSTNQNNIIDVTSKQTLIVREEKLKLDLTRYIEQTDFVFDTVFDEVCSNEDVYKEVVKPLVQGAF
jgi:kinesin family protein 2/24